MSLHSYVQGFIGDPTLTINVLTNGSGASQSWALWDIDISVAVGWSAAGFTRNNAILAVDGITVVEIPVILSATNQVANFSFHANPRGFEYPVANGHSMTFTVAAGASFWNYGVHVDYDAVTGS